MTTVKEIKKELQSLDDLSDPRWDIYESDRRHGVQSAVKQRKKVIVSEQEELLRLETMLRYEKSLYQQGYHYIAGIDEVGRGPLAGPVVAACVILPENCKIIGLNDSKKLPKSKHEAIYQAVLEQAIAVGIGQIDNHVIDEVNIYQATKLAMKEAIDNLSGQVNQPDYLLIDAMTLDLHIPQQSIIKGDANSSSIAAASIVAKVTRDKLMADYDRIYPGYGFCKNSGYGTKEHLDGLKNYGVTPIHRKTFQPVKLFIRDNKD